MTKATLNMFLNWGCIMYMIFVPFVAWLLVRKNGLRTCIVLAAALSFLCCAIRLVPSFLAAKYRADERVWLFIHLCVPCGRPGDAVVLVLR